MSDDLGRAGYELFADTDGLKRDLGEAEQKIKASGATAEKAFGSSATRGVDALGASIEKTAASTSRFGGTMRSVSTGVLQGVGIAGFLGVANAAQAAAGAVVGMAGDAIAAASNLREAVSLNGSTFGANAAVMEAWAATASDSFGQSKREALEFASGFGTVFANVGTALDETTERSQKLTRLAADIGSAFNVSSAEASQALKSGLLGESEPLRRFGVFLSDAAVKAKALELGIGGAGRELTEGEKVTARYALILGSTTRVQGMFGRDADSLADAQKRATTALEDAGAALGERLIPYLADATNGAAAFLGEVERLAAPGGPIDELARTLSELSTRGEESTTAIGRLDEQLTDAADNFLDFITPWDTWTAATADRKAALDRTTEGARELQNALRDMPDAAASAVTAGGDVASSIGGVASVARSTAGEVASSFSSIVRTVEDARGELERAGREAASALYDPQILRAELAAQRKEAAELRAIIASSSSTKAQVADAQARLAAVDKATLESEAQLLATGHATDKEVAAIARRWIKTWAYSTGVAKEEMRDLITLLQRVRGAADEAADAYSQVGQAGSPQKHRASGGPLEPGDISWVGERGPELRIERRGSYILSNADAMAAVRDTAGALAVRASSAGAGGTTWNGDVVIHAGGIRDPYELGRIARNAVLDALRYEHR